MAYQVLARKYRPQRFADVVGQDHVTVTLMNALRQGRIAHGYIFSGHRGIGKTTIARILAMALNCRNAIGSELRPTPEPCEVCESCTEIRAGNAVDVIEIDAATNRGIDEIRELRDAARYRPARDKYKIYILDEAHQITDAAFNALLKTLEEPPDHIVFMMATTQPEDIPQTVRSRCQHFSFHAVKLADILNELRGIAEREGVIADDTALSLLAEAGDGSMRDALSIMDQAIASAPLEDGKPRLDASQVRDLMGTVPNAVFEKILEAVDGNRSAEVITVANQLLDAGNSPAQLARQCVRYLRNCLVAKIAEGSGAATELLQISADEQRRAARSAALFSEEELTRFLQVMLRTFDELGYRQEQRFHFELGLLKLVHLRRLLPVEELLSQFPTAAGAAIKPTGGSAATSSPKPAPRSVEPPTQPISTKPAFSPFEQSRKRFEDAPPAPVATPSPIPIPKAPLVAAPDSATLESVAAAAQDASPTLATPPETPAAQPDASAELLQKAAVEALAGAKGQDTASDALDDAEWTIENGELRVQTAISKTMLSMVINPEAEKIVRAALRTAGAGSLKLVLLPGTANTAAPKKPKAAKTGSVQAKALEHPIVQQAQSLFHAEIRSVIDLRDND
ncbi:DNA polymerase III subunit gamma/tau [Edaphobacter sp.]|uniref:DNA polymerase III subunit gamma/tau n=1 Tax=Edaphobacter sp. TaxID=1934404 RepID=UPI002DBC9B74|nr:DNA polymerase III subunit gamma/tau [Edaphobacter sp.]HEU5341428.1 DNA polymerase III subunit gamma/tau [Edaphobacter sp.]